MKILEVTKDKIIIELDRKKIRQEFDGGVDAILISPKKSPFVIKGKIKGKKIGDYWYIEVSHAKLDF